LHLVTTAGKLKQEESTQFAEENCHVWQQAVFCVVFCTYRKLWFYKNNLVSHCRIIKQFSLEKTCLKSQYDDDPLNKEKPSQEKSIHNRR